MNVYQSADVLRYGDMLQNESKGEKQNIWTKPLAVACIAIFCCALWGSAFPAIKIGYQWFDIAAEASESQIFFAGCRFTLAGLIVIVIGSVLSKKMLLPKKTSWKKIAILSCFQTSLHYTCFYIGLAHTTGVKSSILNGTNIFMAILISSLLFRQERLTLVKMIGCVLGFAGIVLVNLGGGGFDSQFHLNGEGMIVLSTVCYGMSSSLIRVYGKQEDSVMLSGYQFTLGGIVMIIIGGLLGGKLDTWNIHGVVILIYLAFLSAIAYTLWALLLRHNDVSKVAIYGFANPVFGAILSAFLLKEAEQNLGVKQIVALVLISIGIYIVQKNQVNKTECANETN